MKLPRDGVLPPEFFDRPAQHVARDLLGHVLRSDVDGRTVSARIVETEAYTGPQDPACHAAARIGRTRRNEAMFGPPGTAYVYRIYGLHWCFNVVTGASGDPAAVLIRAAEPLAGIDTVRDRRGMAAAGGWAVPALTAGPGRLAAALGITGALDGHNLRRTPLVLVEGSPAPEDSVRTGPRIGVSRAADWPLRYWIDGNPFVSRPRGGLRR